MAKTARPFSSLGAWSHAHPLISTIPAEMPNPTDGGHMVRHALGSRAPIGLHLDRLGSGLLSLRLGL